VVKTKGVLEEGVPEQTNLRGCAPKGGRGQGGEAKIKINQPQGNHRELGEEQTVENIKFVWGRRQNVRVKGEGIKKKGKNLCVGHQKNAFLNLKNESGKVAGFFGGSLGGPNDLNDRREGGGFGWLGTQRNHQE